MGANEVFTSTTDIGHWVQGAATRGSGERSQPGATRRRYAARACSTSSWRS